MHPQNKELELFRAISRVNETAYASSVHLANHVLSKTPHCGDILEKFTKGLAPRPFTKGELVVKVLRCWLVNFTVIGLMFLGKIAQCLAGLCNTKNIKNGKQPVVLVDIFVLAGRVLDQKKFTDSYFPELYEAIAKEGHEAVILARIYGARNPFKLRRFFDILKKHHVPIITELELLSLVDFLRLCVFAAIFPLKTLSLAHSLNKEHNLAQSGNDPAAHLKSTLLACLDDNYMSGESRRLVGQKLARILPVGSTVISWYENQVMDKCFYRGFYDAGAKGIKTIAAQLLTWPSALLNNHADPSDGAHHATPNTVLVNGSYFLPTSAGQDFAEDSAEDFGEDSGEGKVTNSLAAEAQQTHCLPYINGPEYKVGPSLRYKELFGEMLTPSDSGTVLMLLSYHPEETERVLALAKPLAERGIPVALKFHPATKWEDYKHFLPPEYKLLTGPLNKALAEATLVVGSGSGALSEAVAVGMPVVAVEGDGVTLNYLPPFGQGELWESIKTAEEFFPAREKILQGIKNDPEEYKRKVEVFRSLLFTNPSYEKIVESFEL